MLNEQMFKMSQAISDIYNRMSQELMLSIIERIKVRGKSDLEREPWLWQLEKLDDMSMLNEKNVKYILEQTGIARELFERIIKNEGLKVYKTTQDGLGELLGTSPSSSDVKSSLESYYRQSFLDIDNLVNQILLTKNISENAVLKVYQSIINDIVARVISGSKTSDQAISEAISQWLDKGFPSRFVDAGGRTWTIENYIRMVTQSTTYRVYNDMRTRASEDMGVNTFYYSIHPASRPACAPIQNKVVTTGASFYSEELGYAVESLYDHDWGYAWGCLGINCRHYLTPFVIGVNYLPDVPEHLKDLTPEQAIENGKKQAKQRAFERAIRNDKYKSEIYKAIGNAAMAQRYKNLLATHRKGLRDLIKENPFLFRDYDREKIYKKTG